MSACNVSDLQSNEIIKLQSNLQPHHDRPGMAAELVLDSQQLQRSNRRCGIIKNDTGWALKQWRPPDNSMSQVIGSTTQVQERVTGDVCLLIGSIEEVQACSPKRAIQEPLLLALRKRPQRLRLTEQLRVGLQLVCHTTLHFLLTSALKLLPLHLLKAATRAMRGYPGYTEVLSQLAYSTALRSNCSSDHSSNSSDLPPWTSSQVSF